MKSLNKILLLIFSVLHLLVIAMLIKLIIQNSQNHTLLIMLLISTLILAIIEIKMGFSIGKCIFEKEKLNVSIDKKVIEEDLDKNSKDDIEKIEQEKEIQHYNEIFKTINNEATVEFEKNNDIEQFSKNLLNILANNLNLVQGEFFTVYKADDDKQKLKMISSYAYRVKDNKIPEYEFGEGLIGQVAVEKRVLSLKNVPNGYLTVESGLGSSNPGSLMIIPVINEDNLIAILEIASFTKFSDVLESKMEDFSKQIAQFLIKIKQ